ncbi:MAG: hypothetical protein JSV89_08895 [Spirochaetaceae bacterium]|nr:MAG: hypothetical protein JSV89_08895 [Spirochaetaceae bacterium]
MGLIIAIIGGALILGCGIAGFVCYRKYALPNMQPLSEQDLAMCRDILVARQGYPWICRQAVKTGECACFPCEKLLRARGLMLQRRFGRFVHHE